MRKKKENARFYTSVPDLIAEVRVIKARFLAHPELPLPWPRFVPTPEHLDADLDRLEKAFEALDKHNISTLAAITRARRDLKTTLGKVARFVELALLDVNTHRQWPGFDLGRHPG